MSKRKTMISIAIVVIIIITSAVILIVSTPKERTIENPLQIYNDTIAATTTEEGAYSISQVETISTVSEEYTRTTNTVVQYRNYDSDKFEIYAEKNCSIGKHLYTVIEHYTSGTLYVQVNGIGFSTQTSIDEVIGRYIPFNLLTPELYATITGTKSNGKTTISFTEAIAPEAWISSSEFSLNHANGDVSINKDGTLTKMHYFADITFEKISIKSSVTTEPISNHKSFPTLSQSTDVTQIDYPDAPILLEQACGYILASSSAQTQYSDSILCEAFGDYQTQDILINTTKADNLTASIRTNIKLTNTGKVGSENQITKEETFQNGKYMISINESDPEVTSEITEADMETMCHNIQVSTIMLPEHIQNCETTKDGQLITLTFSTKDVFTQQIKKDACIKLYADAEILDKQADNYTTEKSSCYITLDITTGIPVASGFYYSGIYTINALPYKLEYIANQQYS